MATDIASQSSGPSPARRKPAEKVIGYDRFIEDHLQKTRSQVKWVEISSAAMILVAGTLAYLMIVVLLDHWLIPGGLGFWGRFAALALLVLGAGGYFAIGLAPLVLRRVNPVYAAHAIEQARPSLKNSLVNFLLLRTSREGISESVYQAVEQQAATRLSQVHVESAVDRSRLIKIASVMTAVVALSCLYLIASPKNPLSTVRRVVLPWAEIAAPTRVTIEEVSPGDTSTFYNGYVTVEAVVRGVDDADPVTLYYSSADGQTVEQPIPMQRPAGAYRHSATLPAGTGGLQQNVVYHIAAGDARSNLFQVEVRPAPTIVIDRVEYHYPRYTGMETATRQHGDLKAIEGTRVTLHAKANQEILAAWLDLDCKGTRNKSFKIDGREATITVPLRLAGKGQSQEFSSYQIRFTNTERHENPQPIRHLVDVVPDQPPDVKFDAPTRPETELAANGRLAIEVRARDPDFALSRVDILAERVDQSGNLLLSEPLLAKEQTEFEGSYTLDPEKLKLKPGDTIRLWAQARDNRRPNDDQPAEPNVSETDKLKIVIVEPAERQPRDNELAKNDPQQRNQPPEDQPRDRQQQNGQDAQKGQQPPDGQGKQGEKGSDAPQQGDQKQPADAQNQGEAKNDQPNDGQQKNQQSGDQAGQGQKGEGQQKEQGGNQSGSKQQQGDSGSDRRVDPMSNPGDAFEEALKHRQQQEQQNGGSSKLQQEGDQQQQSKPDSQGEQNGQQKPANQSDSPNQQPEKDNAQPDQQNKSGPKDASDAANQPQEGNKPGDKQEPGQGAKQQPDGKQQSPMGGQGQSPQDQAAENNSRGKQNQQGESQGQQTAGNQAQKADQSPPNGQGQGAGGKQPGKEQPQPGKPNDPTKSDEQPTPGSGQPKPGEQAKSGDESTPESPEGTRAAEGHGSEQKGAYKPDQKSVNPPGKNPDTQGGDRDNEKGNQGGAGQKTDDNKPSPSPQKANQPRGEKEPSPEDSSDKPSKGDEAKSPSQSEKQSDSKGGEAGDKSGGGKPGGGQGASGKEGTGAPGSSTASDQGNKKAPGAGEGETSDKAGDKVESDKPTGKSDPNQRSGDGTQQNSGEGNKPDGQPGSKQPQGQQGQKAQPPQKPADGNNNKPSKSDPNSSDGSQKPSGRQQASDQGKAPGGGGQPGDNQGEPTAGERGNEGQQPGQPDEAQNQQPDKPNESVGDPANLEYAKKATDLALEHLKDQLNQDKPDQDLLDKLKWTREDLQRFVDHWEQMKRDAQAPGEAGDAARRKLTESLRGLGLKPQGTRIKSNTGSGDKLQNLRNSRRASPPPEYAEQVKAYKQRLAKGQKDEK
jgi:hypothetical protein